MPTLRAYGDKPVVLLTNDDGPPGDASPNIYGFCQLLQSKLGWTVRVVIPDCQKSWVGKAYAISDVITARFFYPLGPDGVRGAISDHPRPLRPEAGETMEWVLLAGTPASCANIGLHNLWPGEIDLVVSGPNHGRNSSTAFALSSGTLGAALAGALAVPIPGPPSGGPSLHTDHIPCIAVSYGVVTRPSPPRANDLAHDAAVDVCQRLWDGWGYEDADRSRLIQVYTVNIPLLEDKLEKQSRRVVWTDMWRNAYGSLFKATEAKQAEYDPGDNARQSEANRPSGSGLLSTHASSTASAGPGAVPPADPLSQSAITSHLAQPAREPLRFKFAPTMAPLLFPTLESLPEGTDAWAFAKGYISVTPIRVEYAGPVASGYGFGSGGDSSGVGVFWDEL